MEALFDTGTGLRLELNQGSLGITVVKGRRAATTPKLKENKSIAFFVYAEKLESGKTIYEGFTITWRESQSIPGL
jgi:hypothetical protein